MNKIRPLFVMLLVVFTGGVSAENTTYAVINVGYSKVDTQYDGESDVSYSGGVAYQFHRQWYAEGGYIVQADKSNERFALSSKGPYFALLGKAGNQHGELYYKVGVSYLDIEQRFVDSEQSLCDSTQNTCGYQDNIFAGLVGMGFDYYLSKGVMLRVEYTYFAGQNDFSSHVTNLGFRYNF
ncbi:hypothetical protein D210916BOD24_07720 [Alteromonas sp. D210916BOD_24]|uniref:outer membrane protein n=1 Tax=Alteromonas sp. D210916BOD_24 TaxID=3157618 RepID=UPI00399CAC4D